MIWHLIDSRTVGGAERHIALLVRALRARGIPAQAVLYSDYGINPWLSQLNAEDLPVRVLDGSFSRLVSGLRSDRPSLLHVHGYKAGILGRAAAALCKIPVVTTFHTGERSSGRLGLYERLDEWTAIVGHRIAVTATVQQRLPFASTVVGSFVPPSSATTSTTLPKRIGFVGRLSHEKQPDFFCRLAQNAEPGLEWHVYGDGPMRQALEQRYTQQVRFHGIVGDMSSVWPTLGLLVMPSLFEGLPLAGLEAMAAGVPILASRVGGMPGLVIDGVTGWLFEPGDIDRASALLGEWRALDAGEQRRIRAACRSHVEQHYSEAQQMEKLLAVYRRAGYPISTQPGVPAFSSAG